MASAKQIEANRRNAQKSTGPKTEAGKLKTKFNSLKHGMTAAVAVLPHEDSQSYEQLRESLVDDYQPVGTIEHMLVETVVVNYWRLLRARRIETASFDLQVRTIKRRNGATAMPTMDDDGGLAASFADPGNTFRNLERYQNAVERSYFRAVEALRKAQAARLKFGSVSQVSTPQTEPRPSGSVSFTGAIASEAPAFCSTSLSASQSTSSASLVFPDDFLLEHKQTVRQAVGIR